MYVADTGNERVQKFTSSGDFITKWGSKGSGDGQFTWPIGIAADGSGNVHVGDSSANRVQKFTSSGDFITKWGSHGSGDGQFNPPRGGAVDVSGNVYVADSNNERVQKFTSSGDFITKWGSRGSGDGQFNKPWGLAVDTSGNVYVSEYDGYRVQMFGPGPVYTLTVTTTGGGTTDPPPGSYNYSAEATANVLAIPSGSYVFDHWELDTVDVGAPNPISVTMDQDHSLHAVFVFSPGPAVPEFPGMNISLFASTRAFLAVAYFTLKRKRHAQLPARFL